MFLQKSSFSKILQNSQERTCDGTSAFNSSEQIFYETIPFVLTQIPEFARDNL